MKNFYRTRNDKTINRKLNLETKLQLQLLLRLSVCNLLVIFFPQLISIYRVLFRPVDRDVFVHDLNRQLGTPSHWLPVDSCKKEDKKAP